MAEEKLTSIEKDINDKLLVNVEKLSKLEEDFGKLFNKDYIEELDSRINSINNKLEEEIVNIKNNLEADISSVRSQYKELSIDFEEALDLVKKSILDRDEIIDLQSQEKEDLISNLESLRNDYLSLKDNIALVNDSRELYNLFEEEREKLERGFEEFSRELLNRLNDTDSDINYVKDMLSSDKNLLLEELDALRSEVDNINNDSRLNELLESKLSLEDSFSGIREELSKFDELEGSLNELRGSVSELDV